MSSADVTAAPDLDAAATIEAWRARGAHQLDSVRFRFIEALARRAAEHSGDTRRILEDKLAKLIAVYGEDLDKAGDTTSPTASQASAEAVVPAMPTRPSIPSPLPTPRAVITEDDERPNLGTLAGLVKHLARQTPPPDHGGVATRQAIASPSSAPELKSLKYFKRTLSKLSADQRLAQSLAKLPGNAGPLNSHHLVHRSLMLMRDLSPDYLQRFIGHVDALLWLDQVSSGHPPMAKEAARTEGDKKLARGKSG